MRALRADANPSAPRRATMDGHPHSRRRGREPYSVDPERRAARAARRRERAARGEAAASGGTYRAGAPVERPAGQVYGARAAVGTPPDPPERDRRRTPLWPKLAVTFGAALSFL